jgi:hypothetical protein
MSVATDWATKLVHKEKCYRKFYENADDSPPGGKEESLKFALNATVEAMSKECNCRCSNLTILEQLMNTGPYGYTNINDGNIIHVCQRSCQASDYIGEIADTIIHEAFHLSNWDLSEDDVGELTEACMEGRVKRK